jgi:excinuclease UvrABC nuclease subunit
MKTVQWLSYQLTVYDPSTTTWHDVPGIYIFAGVNAGGYWKAIYVGKAKSFLNRLSNHEVWDEAARLGATHVHAMVVQQEAIRDTIEAQLIGAYQPPLNVQLK